MFDNFFSLQHQCLISFPKSFVECELNCPEGRLLIMDENMKSVKIQGKGHFFFIKHKKQIL